jgi:aromatic-L-amino-acid/L-tryptophan decarboxylase
MYLSGEAGPLSGRDRRRIGEGNGTNPFILSSVDDGYPLEPSAAEMRSMGEAALEFLVGFIDGLPEAPASDLDVSDLQAARPAPSNDGHEFERVLPTVEAGAARGFNTAGPGYLAYIPGGGLFAAALADFLACGVNRYVTVWGAAPRFAQMEQDVIRWLADQFEYPGQARGILTSGGSMANFSAIVTARHALLGEDVAGGMLYVTDQAHASVAKAAVLAGFPHRAVRIVPTTSDLAMDVEELRRMIREDRAGGLRPFCVVASAGTTNTGRVDPIRDLVGVASEESMWLHVDGAYGGFFQLTDRGRRLFDGIGGAHSITLDPHKGMFLPYGTGSLLVREGRLLREAHHVGAAYLQDLALEEEIPNFADYSPELSRDFRGLRVWLPLMLHGLDAFRAALDEKLDLTGFLYRSLAETPGFDLPWEPDLSVVPFSYRPRNGDVDAFNHRLLDRINESKRVFLSSTQIGGRFVIRACILSHRTHRDRVEEAAEIIRSAAAELDR